MARKQNFKNLPGPQQGYTARPAKQTRLLLRSSPVTTVTRNTKIFKHPPKARGPKLTAKNEKIGKQKS